MTGGRRPPSLRGQFRWRLVALQAMILSVIVTALAAVLTVQGSFTPIEPGDDVIAAVRDAVTRTAIGNLALRQTPRLTALSNQVPDLWFVLRDRTGQRLSHGAVPSAFARIGSALDSVGQARLGWNIGDRPQPAARLQWIATPVGAIQVLTGPGRKAPWYRMLGAAFFAILVFLLPILAIMTLATWLATPLVIRTALRGLDDATMAAARIDIDRRGARLPVAAVPAEVRPLVDAVNTTLARLDEGHERHRRFLADAAHELRTPIAILTMRLGLLSTGAERTRLLEDVARLATLADQLLDLERLRRQMGEAMASLDMVRLARDVASDLAPMAIDAGYAIALEPMIDRLDVLGDRAALERALTNIVQNAIQHGGRRGTILIRLAPGAVVEVHDEGPGIAEHDRTRIFEPFRRAGGDARGAGLGLHLVAEIVALHGGRITALDSPLGGLCMRMTFSAVPPDRRKAHAIPPS